ncbi:response regulator transcription factor [Paraburkholderia hayleyella]|uniref:response regulator transcription factor n=1 Tax=Paraburkholderia hayleyella TaxID=2152889 RepID=UPI00129240D3|nr:response regulator transcription factor [Paraburkholderia hayleyella]
MRIAILEDSIEQAKAVAGWLKKAGHDVVVRHDGDSFLQMIESEPVDLLLLDWDVPGTPGIEVLRLTRERFSQLLPVLMVTQHDDEGDIVHGLNCGADDYLSKPVRERELVARVQAQLRKYYPEVTRTPMLEVGRYVLDTNARSVTVNGVNGKKMLTLSAREFDLALYLFQNIGRIVTKDVLIKQIWGVIDRKYDATLATYISKLRSALELRAKNDVVVSTVYNYGYRLERTTRIASASAASAPRKQSVSAPAYSGAPSFVVRT